MDKWTMSVGPLPREGWCEVPSFGALFGEAKISGEMLGRGKENWFGDPSYPDKGWFVVSSLLTQYRTTTWSCVGSTRFNSLIDNLAVTRCAGWCSGSQGWGCPVKGRSVALVFHGNWAGWCYVWIDWERKFMVHGTCCHGSELVGKVYTSAQSLNIFKKLCPQIWTGYGVVSTIRFCFQK